MTCIKYLREAKLLPQIKNDIGPRRIKFNWNLAFILRVFNPFGKRANWIERHDREFKE